MFQAVTLTSKKRVVTYSIIILIFLIFLYVLLQNIHYDCPFHYFLNIWCPGCGGTRMIGAILQLDFYQAFRYNPLLFILVITGILYFIYMIVHYIKKKEILIPSLKVWIIILILLIIYMILRNIPMFSYLIPTEV